MPNRFILFDLETKKLIGITRDQLLDFLDLETGPGGPPGEGAVLYNGPQDLEPEEKEQALTNIGAAGVDALEVVALGLSTLASTVSGLPTGDDYNTLATAISLRPTTTTVNASIAAAVSGLASVAYVDGKLTGIATIEYVDGKLDGLATTDYVDGGLSTLASAITAADYASKSYVGLTVSSAIAGLASETYVGLQLDALASSVAATYATKASLGDYVTTIALGAALGPYAKTADVASDLATALTPYAKTVDVASNLTAALTPYAKTSDVATNLTNALNAFTYAADKLTGTALANAITDSKLTKLAGGTVGTAAYQNTGAFAANSHNHVAANVTDFAEQVRAQLASALKQGTNITIVSSGTGAALELTINSSGGGGSSSKLVGFYSTRSMRPMIGSYAGLFTRNGIDVYEFDDTVAEGITIIGQLRDGVVLTGGVIAHVHYMAATATTGGTSWDLRFERMNTDMDVSSFDTANIINSTVAVASGVPIAAVSSAITTLDGLLAGELFRMSVTRAVNETNDNMSGDAQVIGVSLWLP